MVTMKKVHRLQREFTKVRAAGGGAIVTAVLLESLSNSSAQTKTRYLPEYTASRDLILPKDFHEWVYVGSQPRDCDHGKLKAFLAVRCAAIQKLGDFNPPRR
jgi:hypothetical protein